MRKLLNALGVLLLAALPALAQQSSINTALPANGQPYTASVVRGNFSAAANDINRLMSLNAGTSAPFTCNLAALGSAWLDNSTSPYTLNYCDGAGSWVAADFWDASAHIIGAPTGRGACQTITAATTTDLGSKPQSCITVSGNSSVSITSLGSSAKAGDLKIVAFNGTNTLVYNAVSLIIPGATNYTTTSAAVCIAESLGSGNWQITGCNPPAGGGSVTSVGLALPSSVFVVTGSPVISNGTLTGSFVSQTANQALYSPDGVSGVPSFRAMVAGDIPSHLIANSKLVQMTTNGFKGNNTSGTSDVLDLTVAQSTALINDCSTLLKGEVPTPPNVTTQFLAGDCTWRTPTALPVVTPQGRLTIASGTPVMVATVSGQTTIYYTPYTGNTVPVWNGATWTLLSCAELSNVTSNSSSGNAGPAAVTTNSNYDLFVWSNSGVCTLTRSAVWTNNTSRSNSLVYQNGILVNNSTITNGPPANQGTYVGTVRSNGSSQIDYIFGAAASGGTACSLGVWNNYNRITTQCVVQDTGTSYSYTSSTIRQARGSAGNQASILIGSSEDAVNFSDNGAGAPGTSGSVLWAVGLDSLTTVLQNPCFFNLIATSFLTCAATGSVYPGIGFHVLSANEQADNSHAATFDANALNTLVVTARN